MAKKDLDVQIEPQFDVEGAIIRGFDDAWRIAMMTRPPVRVTFLQWVRKLPPANT